MRLQEDAHAENTRISTRAIAARLPSTLHRAAQLSWRADRRTVLVLALCTLAFAVLTAVGLHATSALLAAILADGTAVHRLHHALPPLVLVAVAAGAGYLADAGARLAAEVLAPKVNREADLAVITASVTAELGAYEKATFEDGRFAATKGAEKMPDLISGAQALISSIAQLLAAVAVVATLNALLLPLLLLAVFPPRVGGGARRPPRPRGHPPQCRRHPPAPGPGPVHHRPGHRRRTALQHHGRLPDRAIPHHLRPPGARTAPRLPARRPHPGNGGSARRGGPGRGVGGHPLPHPHRPYAGRGRRHDLPRGPHRQHRPG
ncbi:hypothetical protein GCM10020000_85440 [Streptomyces olivoverticillatus]